MFDPTRARWAGGALATVALALFLVVSPTAPTSAHDQILSTTPADGQQLAVAPTEVILRATEDVLSVGAIVLVVDSRGSDWAVGSVRLEGTEAVQALKDGLPDGAYQVRWRVVAVDGHPVSGAFAFSVGALAPTVSTAPSMTATPDTAAPSATATNSDGGMPVVGLVGLIGALIGIAVFALVSLLTRKRTNRRRP